MNRRDFLKTSAFAMAASTLSMPSAGSAATCPKKYTTCLHKALIRPRMSEKLCETMLATGFKGVELSDTKVTLDQARSGRLLAEKNGLRIHSFMGGWSGFGNPDAAARAKSLEETKNKIRLAAAYGAPTMLLVPGRIDVPAMPKAHEFDYEFNPGTLQVSRVVKGDNAPYAEYIRRHNEATRYSIEAINALIPVAAEEGVVLALENVWNNLWVKPKIASAFIRSFNNPWVKCYFDIGNHVKYAPAEEWMAELSDMIVKMHIKDFKIDRSKKMGGTFVPIGKGSINWISVRDAIEKIQYNGWISIEEGGYSEAEYSKIMDRFFAGQPVLG